LSVLSDVDRRLDGVPQLELVCLNRDDLNKGKLLNEILRPLVVKAVLLLIVPRALEIHALNIATVLKLLFDGSGILFLSDNSVVDTLIEWPSSRARSSLNKSSQVRLRSSQTTKPHDLGLFNFIPVFVLLIPAEEMLHPADKLLGCSWRLNLPHVWNETIEETISKTFKGLTHSDNTEQCILQVSKRSDHHIE